MTKIKIMFAVLAVVAVVGSTLAFRAKADNFCHYKLQTPTFCPLVETLSTFTGSAINGIETITPTVNGECLLDETDPAICTLTFFGTAKD